MVQILSLVFAFQIAAANGVSETDKTPSEIVQERNRALNAGELAAFLDTYAENVEIFVYPTRKIGSGKKHIRMIFADAITNGTVRTRVKRTMAADGYVIVESATTFGKKTEEGVAIYEVRKGKIQSVRFVRDTLRAKQKPAKQKPAKQKPAK